MNDALYRLLSATGRETAATGITPWDDLYRPQDETLARGYTQQYDYDKLGNIQSLQHIATGGSFTRSFNYGSFIKNALQKITIGSNDYNFAYDVNGNMLSEGDTARHLEYDCADRLRAFFVQTGTAEPSKFTHYLYDGGGNRVKKITRTQGGAYTATTYIDGAFEYTKESTGFDGIPNLAVGTWTIGVYSGGGEQNIIHIMGGATKRIGADLGDSTPAIKYNLSDHLGSSCVQLDTNGTTVSLEEYYPFGETSFGSYAKKRYRFCGKEKDEESGLYYYGMRYYSSWTCRFINVDPLAGKYPFYTPYQYAGNQPIIGTDEDGLELDPNAQNNGQNGPRVTPTSTTDSTAQTGSNNATPSGVGVNGSLPAPPAGMFDDVIKQMNTSKQPVNNTSTQNVNTDRTFASESTAVVNIKANMTADQAKHVTPYTPTLVDSLIEGAETQVKNTIDGAIEDAKNYYSTANITETLIDAGTLWSYSGAKRLWGTGQTLTTTVPEVVSNIPNYTANDYAFATGYTVAMVGEAYLMKRASTSFSSVKLPTFNATNGGSYVNLASPSRTAHIIAGDATGGGHTWFGSGKSFINGISGNKSMFPITWSNSKIMHAASEVVTSNTWVQQTGRAGARFTRSGQPVRFVTEGSFQGTKIRVINTHNEIITAFPIK